MTDAKLTPQTPGTEGATEPSALESLLKLSVPEIAAQLDEASDEDLAAMALLESGDKDRRGVHFAIEHEQKRRAKEAGAGDPIPEELPVQDGPISYDLALDPDTAYRHLRADQIDTRKIARKVLTKDGWVVPHPSAVPQG